jgi:hypothetical protein
VPEFTLTYRIEASSVQKATAVRNKCAALLEETEGVEVRLSSMGRSMPDWNVIGVDTTSKQPFTEKVEAETEEAAKEKVEATKKATKVVAEVRRA